MSLSSHPKAQSESNTLMAISGLTPDSPPCFLLHFDTFNILLDVGIDLTNEHAIRTLRHVAPTLDAILLSSSRYDCVCGLMYLLVDCGCTARVFATLPTLRGGEMECWEREAESEEGEHAEGSISVSFSRIQELKYSESFILTKKKPSGDDGDDDDAGDAEAEEGSLDPESAHESSEGVSGGSGSRPGSSVSSDEELSILIIQPFASGVLLGGTLWKITNEIDSVVYAQNFSVRSSLYLSGMNLEGCLIPSPKCLILDSRDSRLGLGQSLSLSVANRPKTPSLSLPGGEKEFVRLIRHVIFGIRSKSSSSGSSGSSTPSTPRSPNAGSSSPSSASSPGMVDVDAMMFDDEDEEREKAKVLIPVDAAGRVLEILLILEEVWNQREREIRSGDGGVVGSGQVGPMTEEELRGRRPRDCEIVLLSRVGKRVVKTYASSLLTFMSEEVNREFIDRRRNPFDLHYVRCVESVSEVLAIAERKSVVVLATGQDIEFGFARELFARWVSDPACTIALVQRGKRSSLGRRLRDHLDPSAKAVREPLPESLTLIMRRKQKLSGQALEDFLAMRRRQKEEELRRKREEEERKKIVQIVDDDDTVQGPGGGPDQQRGFRDNDPRLFLPENMRYNSPFLMFPPVVEPKFESDDYGEVIDVNALREASMKMLREGLGAGGATSFMDSDHHNHMQQQAGVGPDGAADDADADPDAEIEIPSVFVEEEIVVRLLARLKYFNLEGRADSNSIQNILKLYPPRQVIPVCANVEDAQFLRGFCRKAKVTEDVPTPRLPGEKVVLKTEQVLFRAKLSSELIDGCNLSAFRDCEIGYFEGVYVRTSPELPDEPSANSTPNSSSNSSAGILISKRESNLGHAPIFLGNVKLNEFKDVLNEHGVATQFKMGGGIICNGRILLTKDPKSGKMKIHGPICADYYRIRGILYDQFRIV